MHGRLLLLATWCAVSTACGVDFTEDVRPIFQKHCIKCHGPEKQKSGYRLDVAEIALKGGDLHAPHVVPNSPETSSLLRYVSGEDSDFRMPPKGDLLSPDEIAVLRAWIAEGAQWPENASAKIAKPTDWWSLRPLERPAVPQVAQGLPGAESNPVDAFVREKLRSANLAPSKPATREALCRRVYFDLTGLPPTPEELDAFVADRAGDAFARLVDRLLASPRYGERWARHWLDVVHYGDTHGYDKDKLRLNAWPYRDYVIRAFNVDKPYARFVSEQIAGDVIFPEDAGAIEALGFLSAGPWDFIGHAEVPETKVDGKIARHLDRDDMVSNTLGTFCATTVHCAQCHNHKFDPISQEDYYSLQSVFAAIDRTDKKYFDDPSLNSRYEDLSRRIVAGGDLVESTEKQAVKEAGKEAEALSQQISEARKKKSPVLKEGEAPPEHGYHSALSRSQDTLKWVQADLGLEVLLKSVVLVGSYDDFNGIGAGFGFPVRYRIEASNDPAFQSGVHLLADKTKEDYANPGVAPQKFEACGEPVRYLRVTATKLALRAADYIFALAELQALRADGSNAAQGAKVTALDSIESGGRWSRANLVDGIYTGSKGPVARPGATLADLEKQLLELLRSKAKVETFQKFSQAKRDLEEARKEIGKFPASKTVFAGAVHSGKGNFKGTGGDGGRPRPVFLLARGQVTQPGREMFPGALSALDFQPGRFEVAPSAPEGERRAALAQWIVDPKNPLTWRTIVNRVWQYHFGAGLVETPGDFGRNGGLPSHLELLDWLAVEFRDGGGSLKALHRLILASKTYQQSSADRAEFSKIDSGNRFLWRQNRRKLEAEAIRDAVLASSGNLDLTMGGPGWQDFVIEHPEHSPHFLYERYDPADAKTFRRSVYRFIVRSQTQPWMTSLDCADPSMRVDRRTESLSPLQALALLNNGFLLTQAEALSKRVAAERNALPDQVHRAFRLALSRSPSSVEVQTLAAYAGVHGMAQTCRLMLNLNEFTFID
jgi:hypothetical protein